MKHAVVVFVKGFSFPLSPEEGALHSLMFSV